MDIVIVAQYLGDLEHLETTNSRFTYLGRMLAEKNEVEIVTTTFLHVFKRQAEKIPKFFEGCKITALYEPGYPRNVCLKRFGSHHKLAENIKKYLRQRKKPDIVYAAVPSLSVASQIQKYCCQNSVRFIIDVQDLWPEAFKMVINIPLISNMLFYPMKKQAERIYSSADEIVAVSQTYADRALKVNRKCKGAEVVYLGTDKTIFDKYAEAREILTLNDEVNMELIRLVYIGTLGHSYDISVVLDALKKLSDEEIKKVQFIIIGDGPKRKQFEQEAVGLPVIFAGMVTYPEMVWLLCRCDIAVNPIKQGAAQSIINKQMDYAMAGLAIINSQECIEYRDLLDKYNCGINCVCGNSDSIMEAIQYLIYNESSRKEMGKRHRIMAEELFDRGQSYKRIVDCIEKRQ